MTEEEIKNIIKNATVKITTTINNSIEKGTGVLIKQETNYYILTVHHCIYGKNEPYPNVENENIELEFHSNVLQTKLIPSNITPLSKHLVLLQLESAISCEIAYECLDKALYEKNYHIRGFPRALNGKGQYFKAECNDNDIDTIGFSIDLKGLTSDTTGESAVTYISGLSGSGIFFSENNKLYLIGLINALGTHGGVFNRVDCIKLIDLHYSDIKIFDFYTITGISKKLKDINKRISEDACQKFEEDNTEMYTNLNRKHTNIFYEQDVLTKNFQSIKNYLQGKNSISEIKLLNTSFEKELLILIDDILDEIESKISKYIDSPAEGRENLRIIQDQVLEAIKDELELIKKDRYISNKLQEYMVVGWLLNCNVDFVLGAHDGN